MLRHRPTCRYLFALKVKEYCVRRFPFLFRHYKLIVSMTFEKSNFVYVNCYEVPELAILLLLFSPSLKLPQRPHRLNRLIGGGGSGIKICGRVWTRGLCVP